jgi:hypothetical protein
MSEFKWMTIFSAILTTQFLVSGQYQDPRTEIIQTKSPSVDNLAKTISPFRSSGEYFRFVDELSEKGCSSVKQIFLSYEPKVAELTSKDNLKYNWALACAENLAKRRISSQLKLKSPTSIVFTEGKYFFPSSVSIRFLEEDEYTLSSASLIEDSLVLDIADQEVILTKQEILQGLIDLLGQNKTEEQQFIYDSLENEFADFCSFMTFSEFLEVSYTILQEMSAEEICEAMQIYFDEANKVVEEYTLDEYDDYLDSSNSNFLSSITLLPEKEKVQGFSALKRGLSNQERFGNLEDFEGLRLTETDKKNIKKLVTTLAENNVFQLLLDKKSIERRGKMIRPVHPLRFLGFIVSDSHLRRSLSSIKKSYFKWKNFVEGFEEKMKDMALSGDLLPYVKGFSETTGMDPNTVSKYIYDKDYEGLMKYFL